MSTKKFREISKGVKLKKEAAAIDYDERNEGAIYNENDTKLKTQIDGADREVITDDQTQTVSNKTLDNTNAFTVKNTNFTVQDESDTTKQFRFEVTSISSATTRTYTVPNEDTTLVGTGATQTVTNKTIDADSNTISNVGDEELKAGIDAAKLADGSVSNTELQHINSVTSNVQDQIDTKAADADLTNHLNDTTDAHDGSAISNVPAGNLAATDMQGAVDELQTDIDTRALSSDLTTHTSDTTTHGTTGDIVGTSDTQTVTNKTIDGNNNTLTVLDSQLATAVSISKGGSGQTAQQAAIDALSNVSGATNEYVLTKDTASGNAVFKAPSSSAVSLIVSSKSAAYTLVSGDDVILCDSSGGIFTLTLPAAASNSGKVFYFKKTSSDLNAITIDGNLSETIDGVITTTINTQFEMLDIVSDGTNWQILNRKIDNSQQSFTPTGSWLTNTTYNGFYVRDGKFAYITYGVQLTGVPTTTTLTLDLPTGLVIDNTVFNYGVGGSEQPIFDSKGGLFESGAGYSSLQAHYFNTSKFQVWTTANRGAGTNATKLTNVAPIAFNNADRIYVHIKIPIVGWNGN